MLKDSLPQVVLAYLVIVVAAWAYFGWHGFLASSIFLILGFFVGRDMRMPDLTTPDAPAEPAVHPESSAESRPRGWP